MKLFSFKEKEPPRGEYKEDILKMIEDECHRRHEERRPLELKWMLNSDFYSGHQYRDLNPYRGELEDYEPPYDYMERGVYNRIAPLIETRIANFKSLDFSMAVHPATSEMNDYEKSLESDPHHPLGAGTAGGCRRHAPAHDHERSHGRHH